MKAFLLCCLCTEIVCQCFVFPSILLIPHKKNVLLSDFRVSQFPYCDHNMYYIAYRKDTAIMFSIIITNRNILIEFSIWISMYFWICLCSSVQLSKIKTSMNIILYSDLFPLPPQTKFHFKNELYFRTKWYSSSTLSFSSKSIQHRMGRMIFDL